MELTNREYLELIIKNNHNFIDYLSYEYNKFLEEILPYSKKTRSSKMFELCKKSEEIEFIKNYDITKLTSNEFLSNKIIITRKNSFQIKFGIQILDYFFQGKIIYQKHIEVKNNEEIINYDKPLTVRDVIIDFYSNKNINVKNLEQEYFNKKINNRIKKNNTIFKKYYKSASDIPINNNLMCHSYLWKLVLNIKIQDNASLKKITDLIENQYNKSHQLKRIKTKFKKTDNYDYDLKEHFVRKMENYKSYYGYEKKPKWPYNLSKMMGHSITNRERKKRYYLDGETKFLKVPHRNKLRYKSKY